MTLDPRYTAFDAYGNEYEYLEIDPSRYWNEIKTTKKAAEQQRLAELERNRLWTQARVIVLAGNPTCVYCRIRPANSVDHIVAQCRGGDDELSNYAASCRLCNSRKGKFTPLEWLHWLEGVSHSQVLDTAVYIPLTEEQHMRLAVLIAEKYLVDQAETALRAFGNLSKAEAAKLLPSWAHYRKLTRDERRAVLGRFTA